MNNKQDIKGFLVVFEDENENEYQSSIINKESSLFLLKESIEYLKSEGYEFKNFYDLLQNN